MRMKADHEGLAHLDARAIAGRDQIFGFGHAQGDGLFTEHMLTRLRRPDGPRGREDDWAGIVMASIFGSAIKVLIRTVVFGIFSRPRPWRPWRGRWKLWRPFQSKRLSASPGLPLRWSIRATPRTPQPIFLSIILNGGGQIGMCPISVEAIDSPRDGNSGDFDGAQVRTTDCRFSANNSVLSHIVNRPLPLAARGL